MHSLEKLPGDDRLTVIAISAVAYIFQDVCHEGGHSVAGWLAGAHRITVSTVAFQIDIDSLWAVAAGVLVNLISAALLLLLYDVQEFIGARSGMRKQRLGSCIRGSTRTRPT